MGQIFGSLYCIFEDFFGLDLANYLWGIASKNQTTNLFVTIGLIMLVLSGLIAVLYYYVVNKPTFNKKWLPWLIFMIVDAALNFFIGWGWLQKDLDAGLMVRFAQDNKTIDLNIGTINCLNFGITNLIIACFFFFIISLIIKWRSSNCPKSPF